MKLKCNLWCALILLCCAGEVVGQESTCYGPGSIATSVIVTIVVILLIFAGVYFWWRKCRSKKEQLILESDPEKGKGEYAFDNPGFKDTSLLPAAKASDDNKLETSKSKWNQWSPLTALTHKSEKRKTVDDTALQSFQGNEVKVVELRSHDFTGLGFKICGNMKEGIYIKDILHRGPAFESGKLNPGDRINSVTISFEHMVYEDALAILSYASPYEVIIEAKSGKLIQGMTGQGGQPSHPVYRSSSCVDLFGVDKSSKKRLFGDEYNSSLGSNYSSLQKSRSNMTTLERKESKSPRVVQPRTKKLPPDQLEQRILADHQHNLKAKDKIQRTEAETQKAENKYQRFGVRVLPPDQQQKSPKIKEQNENNVNIEKRLETMPPGIDEVDQIKKQPPPIKKREKKSEEPATEEKFERTSLNGSGIQRDKNGIPQELPTHMLNAAVAARRNRKSSDETELKKKGKAPSPPEHHDMDFDEIKPLELSLDLNLDDIASNLKHYNSDSDVEPDIQSSVNTIELNSSDITIHQTEEEVQNRKTVSTGDLTKLEKNRKISSGTLERAQSLDISDSAMPTLNKKRKGQRPDDNYDLMKSDEDIFGQVILSKEPRLSLMLNGLNTFQRNRLKKSTEWGNLEDAILKTNQDDDDSIVSIEDSAAVTEKSPELDAVLNKIKEIKTQSPTETKTIKNEIWPGSTQPSNGHAYVMAETNQRQVKPAVPPPPVKLRPVHNRIDEPFKNNNSTPSSIPDRVNRRQRVPEHALPLEPDAGLLIDHWKLFVNEDISNTSSPSSLHDKDLDDNIMSETVRNTDSKRNEVAEKNLKIETKLDEVSNTVLKNEIKPDVVWEISRKIDLKPNDIDVTYDGITNKMGEKSEDVTEILRLEHNKIIGKSGLLTDMEYKSGVKDEEFNKTMRTGSNLDKSREIDVKYEEVTEKIRKIDIKPNEMTEKLQKIRIKSDEIPHKEVDEPVIGVKSGEQAENQLKIGIKTEEIREKTHKTSPKCEELCEFSSKISEESVEMTEKPGEIVEKQNEMTENPRVVGVKFEETAGNMPKISAKPEEVLSKIPLLESMVKSQQMAASSTNNTDECKTAVSAYDVKTTRPDLLASTRNFLYAERSNAGRDRDVYTFKSYDTNASDDIKVSRHSQGSLERPKSDDAKTEDTRRHISNINVTTSVNGDTELHSLELSINGNTADSKVTISTPDLIKNAALAEVMKTLNNDEVSGDAKSSTVVEVPSVTGTNFGGSLTYITEIQVTPQSRNGPNVSEIEIVPASERNLDTEFEKYVKNFESKLEQFESNIQDFDKNLEEVIKEEPRSVEKIQEEQLKRLPAMRFTTASYESKVAEKRTSQIEMLRSNFEKASPKSAIKSRIPIATTIKTPPTSPERRDSRNLDNDQDKAAILELMSSKYQVKPSHKNVTVTSIRTNSKIPSGLPTLAGRPPVAPRRVEANDGNNVNVQVSSNGATESSFKQWVFNPANVTNVTVTEHKQEK